MRGYCKHLVVSMLLPANEGPCFTSSLSLNRHNFGRCVYHNSLLICRCYLKLRSCEAGWSQLVEVLLEHCPMLLRQCYNGRVLRSREHSTGTALENSDHHSVQTTFQERSGNQRVGDYRNGAGDGMHLFGFMRIGNPDLPVYFDATGSEP
jgi:hypothetical protein